jgi:hypothetical protein
MSKTEWLRKYLDSSGYVNPYQVPQIIWSLIQEQFSEKYGVEVTDMFPAERVERPTIAWRIYNRVPGGGKEGLTNAKGSNFRKIESRDENGRINLLYVQEQRVTYEFAVFGPTNQVAEDIAWDLELAILETVGELQQLIPGFHMFFLEQIGDTTLAWRRQDELCVRTLRFLCQFPVKRIQSEKTIDTISKNIAFGEYRDRKTVTRTSDSDVFYIPVNANQRVKAVLLVGLYDTSGEVKPLVQGTDYDVLIDENQVRYIKWLKHGVSPSVGESFRVDFLYAPLVRDYTVK